MRVVSAEDLAGPQPLGVQSSSSRLPNTVTRTRAAVWSSMFFFLSLFLHFQ
jgi:hypothetical protein